jgi:hypothetical protein
MRSLPKTYEPLDNSTLIALAKQRARVLRREAVPVFWADVDMTVAQTMRSLSRYLRSLARHCKLRGHSIEEKAV